MEALAETLKIDNARRHDADRPHAHNTRAGPRQGRVDGVSRGALRRRMHGERLKDDRAEYRADKQLNEVGDRQELAQAKAHEP